MRPRSRPRTLERRIAALDLRRVDAESRTVEVSFSSETTGIRSPWSGNPEVLLHEDGAADFSRLEDLGTVLFNHDPDQVIGRPERIRLDLKARKGRARIIFDDDAETERVFQKIRGGSIKGVSVGFRVAEWQLLEEGQTWHSKGGREFRGPMDIAVKWFAFEISVVAVPADAGVGVGRAATERKCSMSRRKTPAEAPAENLEEREVETAVETPEERSIASERERIATITDLFSEFGSRGAAIAADHIRLGTSIGDARKIFVEEWRRDRPPIMLGGPRIDYGTDSREKLVRDATDGLLMRANILRDEKRSRELTHFSSLVELARACLHERGVRTQGLRVVELCQRAMSHTTSDFPKIL